MQPYVTFESISRSPHGERGLKSEPDGPDQYDRRRSPHGERGLKFADLIDSRIDGWSLSSRRAWIEIRWRSGRRRPRRVALLTESVD